MTVIPIRKEPQFPAERPVIDKSALEAIADWRAMRARLKLAFAEEDKASLFHIRESKTDHDELRRLWDRHDINEHFMAQTEPLQIATVCELLRACVDIMAHGQGEGDRFGEGPVLEIVKNCLEALDWLPSEMAVGNPKDRKRCLRNLKRDMAAKAGGPATIGTPTAPAS